MTDGVRDPVASVDASVAAIHPGVTDPGIEVGDAVLVTGPWLAGSTSLAEALRARMPEQTIVEAGGLPAGQSPAAVVFVASARAQLTESDCALLDAAAANTDLVIGAVSKIDAHDNWREVLATDRAALSAHDHRYRDVAWVGVAAAPAEGEPELDDLVDALGHGLGDAGLARRNRLRAWQHRLREALRRHDDDAAGVGRQARMASLREQRGEMQRRRREMKSERTAELARRVEQAQVQLGDFARHRCTSVRGELAEDGTTMTRRRMPSFAGYVGERVEEVVGEVDAGVAKHLGDLAAELGLTPPERAPAPAVPPVSPPPLPSRRRRAWLLLVGAVAGCAAAFAVSRLFPGPAPGLLAAWLAGGALVGIAVAAFLVRLRGLLQDRAMVNHWITEVVDGLRGVMEGHVADRVRVAQRALTAEQDRRLAAEAAELDERIAGIDAELREHATAAHAAEALRSRELPPLQRALQMVQSELDGDRSSDN